MIQKLSHIGIVVGDLAAAEKRWTQDFGMKVFRRMEIEVEKIRSVFLSPHGTPEETYFELMEPLDKADMNNPVARRLARTGEGVYQVALLADDVESNGRRLAERGITVLERPPIGPDAQLRWLVHPRSANGVLLELI